MTVDLGVDAGARMPTGRAPAAVAAPAAVPAVRRQERAGSRGLSHEPALDGLRGLAIAVVVVFHLDRLQGGFLGVDLFFVLSGYLITSLLVAEHHRTGRIGLGGFWARRARRLLPALFVLLVGVGGLLLFFTPEAQRAGFQDDALATLGYVANWQRMFAEVGYWDMFSQPSPLDHMWSLAIEEQFYVLWPIVALLVLGHRAVDVDDGGRAARRLGVVSLGAAAVSFVLLAVTFSPEDTNRAYFATDTRIGPTLLGAALAAFTAASAASGRAGRVLTGRWRAGVSGVVVGMVALAWMTWSVRQVDGVTAWYYRGGLITFALAAVVLIVLVTRVGRSPIAAAVSWRPLRALGTISYGVYLWHWPVIVYVTSDRAHLGGLGLDVLRVAATLALSVASYQLIERPIRRGTFDAGRLRIVGAGAFAVTLVAVMVATSGEKAPSAAAEVPPDTFAAAFDPDSEWASTHRHLPDDVAPGTPKLLLVGDSGVAKIGFELVRQAELGGVAVAFSSEGFCSVIFADDISLHEGEVIERPYACSEGRRKLWRGLIERYDPDVVVHYLANGGSWFKERVDDQWVWDCDEPYDAYLREGLSEDMELLQEGGAKVLFATTPYVNPDLAQREPTADRRVDCRNETYGEVVAAHPGSATIDLNRFVEEQRAETGSPLFVDDVHLDPEGIHRVVGWVLAESAPELPPPAPEAEAEG